MSFGKMRELIDIVETVTVKDADGFATSTDDVLASVRAYHEERHGNTSWANRASFSTASSLFRFRVILDFHVTPSHQIICRGERYKILSVEDVRGRGMYVECLAERITAVKGGTARGESNGKDAGGVPGKNSAAG